MTRNERAKELLFHSAAYQVNGMELPEVFPRYVGVEISHDGDVYWAYFGDTFQEIADAFNMSDTEGVVDRDVYDLDGTARFVGVQRMAFFLQVEPTADHDTRIEVD